MASPTQPTDITTPISPTRFAAALKDLSIASLHLKVLEIRNALLHLAHSNAQLRPFADGTQTSLDLAPGEPDQDCVDAIRENEIVIARMHERIELVKAEVEARGASWREFEVEDEEAGDGPVVGMVRDDEPGVVVPPPPQQQQQQQQEVRGGGSSRPLTNGVNGTAGDARTAATTATTRGNPWTDGTFQVGTIRNGELHMDSEPPQRNGVVGTGANNTNTATATATSTATSTSTQTGAVDPVGQLADSVRRILNDLEADDHEESGLHL